MQWCRSRKEQTLYIHTKWKKIEYMNEQKDLGILVCSYLMPRKHIEAVCSKVNRKTGMTKRCFMNKSREQMSKIYETVSRPVLEYASTVWSHGLRKIYNSWKAHRIEP